MRNPFAYLGLVATAVAVTVLVMRPAVADEARPPAVAALAAQRPFPLLTVTGTTELVIAPDEAWVHLGVETFLPTMDQAVGDNDQRMAKVINALKTSGVAAADLTTEVMHLAETDRFIGGGQNAHGWEVKRALVARVKKLETLEPLLQQVVRAGATHIHAVRFSHSQIAEKKVDARVAAVKAAREKAKSMALALGQGIGRAVTIKEAASSGAFPLTSTNYANMILNGGGTGLDGATLAGGRVSLEIEVEVQFELL